jgi:hypothetical protein
MLLEFLGKLLLPLWGKTNYFPRQKYPSSFYYIEDESSISLLNLGTDLPNNNVSQLRIHYGVLSPSQETKNFQVLRHL